jgi:hypothetical protein
MTTKAKALFNGNLRAWITFAIALIVIVAGFGGWVVRGEVTDEQVKVELQDHETRIRCMEETMYRMDENIQRILEEISDD